MFQYVCYAVVQPCDFVNKRYLYCTDFHVSFESICSELFLISAAVIYSTQKKGRRRNTSPSSLWKERAQGKGGRRNEGRGEGKHTQTEPCLTSSRTERRKDWYKASATEQKRKREGGRAEGINAKKAGREEREKKMHKSCISSCPQGTKNIVFVNGSWWAQPQGECNEKPGRFQSLVLLSTNPLPLCLSLPARTEPWYDLGNGWGLLIGIWSFMF